MKEAQRDREKVKKRERHTHTHIERDIRTDRQRDPGKQHFFRQKIKSMFWAM